MKSFSTETLTYCCRKHYVSYILNPAKITWALQILLQKSSWNFWMMYTTDVYLYVSLLNDWSKVTYSQLHDSPVLKTLSIKSFHWISATRFAEVMQFWQDPACRRPRTFWMKNLVFHWRKSLFSNSEILLYIYYYIYIYIYIYVYVLYRQPGTKFVCTIIEATVS